MVDRAKSCDYCGEPLPTNFEVCWNCGASADGVQPPTRKWDTPTPPSNEVPTSDSPQVTRFRFRLIHLLWLTTIVAVVLGCSGSADALFLISAVILTNLLGMIVGLLVTAVWGLPNDGSLPPACRDESDDGGV